MSLTDENISEIAELLECGLICFYHRPSGKIESHPDPDSPYYDPEPSQDLIDKIEEELNDYQKFEKMEAFQAFQVMENFASSLNDTDFRDRILNRLSERKPFQNFKNLIDRSGYRQDWFAFKKKAYIDFVKRQIESEN